jgi:hypothetical protein
LKGQNLLEFSDRFKTDNGCKECLALNKAKTVFKCSRYNHTVCQPRDDFSRQCNICRLTESANVDTLFHKVKFGVRKAFFFCFEMATSTKRLSASYMVVRYGVTEKTARLFRLKIREAMSSKNLWMDKFTLISSFWVVARKVK